MEQFMGEYGVHVWVILGILLGIAEMLTVAFFALPFALGAFCAAIAAWLDMPLNGQLAIFALSSIAMLFVIQWTVRKYFTSSETRRVRTNSDALVGEQALVLQPIRGSVTRGSVKVGGEEWSALAEGEQSFEPETIVRVLEVQGAKLLVGCLDQKPTGKPAGPRRDIA